MSMITRCPECSTMFKVVPDQLRVSEGWVRCGQCGQVFDGNANLQPTLAPEQPEQPEQPLPAADAWQERAEDVPPEPDHELTEADALNIAEDSGPEARDVEQPWPVDEREADADLTSNERSHAGLTARLTTPALETQTSLDDSTADSWGHQSADVSFVRAARRQAFWAGSSIRWALAGSCLLLSLALALQWVVHERDWIAATQPAAKPWLQSLCEPLDCRIEALKLPDAIAIENSSFSPVRGDVYRLQVTVKNTARTEVARPALELTLTDSRDAALLRRVLLPSDFSGDVRPLVASGEWSGSLVMRVVNTGDARVTGYRVLAFYP
jgi:predicted Zn finger-like uncharacterized protein